MDFGSFREKFENLAGTRQKSEFLLEYTLEHLQSEATRLGPLVEETKEACLKEGLVGPAAHLIRMQGWLELDQAAFPAAYALFEQTRDLFLVLGDDRGVIKALNGIASVHMSQGNEESALEIYREALALAEKLGDEPDSIVLRANLGETLVSLHQYAEAEQHLVQVVRSDKLSPLNTAVTLIQWARACRGLGKAAEARQAADRAVALSREGNHFSSLARALDLLGSLDQSEGNTSQALARLTEARAAARQCGDQATAAEVDIHLGRFHGAQGSSDVAKDLYLRALDTAREIGSKVIEAEVWENLVAFYKATGRWEGALDAHEKFHELNLRLYNEKVTRQVTQLRADQAKKENELLKAQTRTLALLGDIGRRITASLNLETILVTVYEAIGGLMRAEFFGVGLYQEATGTIDYRLFIEEGVRVTPFQASVNDDTFSGWCIRHRRDLLVHNSEKEFSLYMKSKPPEFGAKDKSTLSCLYTPLLAEGRVLGVLTAQCYEPGVYNDRDLETLKTLGTSIAVAIQNAALYTQVREMATVDTLTRAASRAYLFERTEEEFRNFLRSDVRLSLVMIDLDHFKALNDTWGHSTGDRVLEAFGALFLGQKRTHDVFGRYGGEEFALVLSGSDLGGAIKLAQRFCEAVAAMEVQAPDGTPIRVTASFGVTEFLKTDEGITRVFSRADEALYQAKQAGRNRVSAKAGTGPSS